MNEKLRVYELEILINDRDFFVNINSRGMWVEDYLEHKELKEFPQIRKYTIEDDEREFFICVNQDLLESFAVSYLQSVVLERQQKRRRSTST